MDEHNLFAMENDLNTDWPRFLVMEDSVKDSDALKKLSPFAISKGIIGLAGEPKSVKKTSFGLLIEVVKKCHADCLLKTEVMANIPVKVSPHRTLNTVKGVIRCKEVRGMPEAEIAKELHDQFVTDVKRIYIHRRQTPTDTYILTFGKTDLPSAIKVGYMNVKVNPYIPNPLRCYKCQDYGHGSDKCTHKERCSRCGQGHSRQNCTVDEPHCVHCSLNHETSDRECNRYKQEKQIQRIKVMEKLSFPEARKRVLATTAKPTYAAAVSSTVKVQVSEQETQTTIYWVLGDKPSNTPPAPKQKKKQKSKDASSSTEAESLEESIQQNAASPGKSSKNTATATTLSATAAASTAVAAEKSSQDRFDILRNYAAEFKPDSPLANLTRSRSINELSGTTSTEIGPSPASEKSTKHAKQFPLGTNKEKGTKDRDKFIPSHRVKGPNKK